MAQSQRGGRNVQAVYFNVDGFVIGRDAKRAMLATTSAGIH